MEEVILHPLPLGALPLPEYVPLEPLPLLLKDPDPEVDRDPVEKKGMGKAVRVTMEGKG